MRNDPAAEEDGTVVGGSGSRSGVRASGSGLSATTAARIAGLLVALVAIGVGQLAAALGTPAASPVLAVGKAIIDGSPQPVKSWAIRVFATADKAVLVTGILVVLLTVAVLLGPSAVRRPGVGLLALAIAAAVGAAAAVTRPGASSGWAVPSLLAGAAGAVALSRLSAPLREPLGAAVRPTPARTDPRVQGDVAASTERPIAFDRRRFLRAALVAGAVGVGSAAVGVSRARDRSAIEAARAAIRVPRPSEPAPAVPRGADLGVPGLSPFVTPNDRFYRVDTALFVPEVDVRTWRLTVSGSVERPATLSFEDLLDGPLIERDVTLACVSNEVGGPYVGNARWIGVPLAPLLRQVGIDPGADQLVSRSVDGFTAGTPMRLVLDGRDAMLAMAMNGDPLPLEHGFPVRMVVPGLYGYESATKWLSSLEATTYDAYDPYWVQRGWAPIAPIKTQSRIDTPRNSTTSDASTVVVAGVAWAQHTGIAGVEVRVDDGPWNQAHLAAQDSIDTWRQWRWDWDARPGEHTLTVRATDGDGRTQPGTPTPTFPNGAAGWHRIAVTIS
jgi:DMSO/TMAO reductase YedYZ molybdopterin-dependent catalytic subunit